MADLVYVLITVVFFAAVAVVARRYGVDGTSKSQKR
jgi:hypothetical protein